MTFTSIGFFYFLLALLALSLVFGRRRRWLVLLVASYAFYAAWGLPHLLAALAVLTLSSYLCAIRMERQKDPARRNALLWLGLAALVLIFVALRNYGALFPHVLDQTALETSSAPRPSDWLPFAAIGVSYYVLQAVSYLLDVHAGVVVAERNLGRYALHVAFFPKLLQGPIERAEHLLPQLRDLPALSLSNMAVGAQLFLWGLFQKVVVADRLAPFVDTVYGDVHRYQGVPLLVATYFFAAQLYFDFAGYTDMALGVARLFGIRLTQNFNSPYLSASVAEFWRRWHISFSSWLLDYIFRPLQLSLRDWRTWGTPAALVVTFLVSGLWHGATWCFVVWGLLHGTYLGASMLYRGWQKKLHQALGLIRSPLLKPLQVALTFHLICFAWIFFRARSLGDALYTVRHLVSGLPASLAKVAEGRELESLLYLGQGAGQFAFVLVLLASGGLLRAYLHRVGGIAEIAEAEVADSSWQFTWVRTAVYAVMLYLIVFLGTTMQSFIYQQF
jgi:alginate O-acetyltransferase complex protein AlgI